MIRSGICLALLTCSFYITHVNAQSPLALWYEQPASDWNEALPVGNGRLGAMVFGGVNEERLQLNEETCWSGTNFDFVNPAARKSLGTIRELLFQEKYVEAKDLAEATLMGDKRIHSSYQTLGDLRLYFDHDVSSVKEYRRELDIADALAKVSYQINGARYDREVFSSAPDNVIVARITSSGEGSVSFRAELSRPGNKAELRNEGDHIVMTEHIGAGTGVKMVTRVFVKSEGGSVEVGDNHFQVSGGSVVTILITAATDYRGDDPFVATKATLDLAKRVSYSELRDRHLKDYQHYFNRVRFDIGESDAAHFPVDQRLRAFQRGSEDPQLLALYFQFGRYLLISSSRPGSLPANLQGIWADGLNPPWDADYHININIQMNYWPAEITNLHELHRPFLDFLVPLTADGKKTARSMYGLDGAVAHFTTDAWHFTEPYGQTLWAMWPMGLAWSASHLWEHYQFKTDDVFLKEHAYPVMKEAAMFCLDWLVENPRTKNLVSGPSISPENKFRTPDGGVATMVMGPTMDHMIIRELFRNTVAAATILKTDASLRRRIARALDQLAPTSIGSDGRIMEWTEEFEEPEPGHRHISHLYGLFPGNEITMQNDSAVVNAARKTISYRLSHGGGHTGWSRAWIINFFARLQDGDASYENLRALLAKSTLPNLFDDHPPFQIDGNFGATAGIAEMLLQSHAGQIEVLPALPHVWSDGSISGLCARGGFEVDISWKRGALHRISIISREGKHCRIRYGPIVKEFATVPGAVYVLDQNLAVAEDVGH